MSTEESSADLLPMIVGNVSDVIEQNKENGWPGVPAKTKVFCHEYSICFSLDAARKRVGISRDRASRLVRDPLVRAYIDSLVEELREETLFRREFVELEMMKLLDEVSGNVDMPSVTRDGEVFFAPHFNPSVKLQLLKEMKGSANAGSGEGGAPINLNINFGDLGVAPAVEIEGEVIDATPP